MYMYTYICIYNIFEASAPKVAYIKVFGAQSCLMVACSLTT